MCAYVCVCERERGGVSEGVCAERRRYLRTMLILSTNISIGGGEGLGE